MARSGVSRGQRSPARTRERTESSRTAGTRKASGATKSWRTSGCSSPSSGSVAHRAVKALSRFPDRSSTIAKNYSGGSFLQDSAGQTYPSGEHRGLGGTAALDGGLARPALGECGDVLGQPIDVEDMGIEVVREPFFELAMARVVGIGDGLEEFGIAPGTADVLGRAATLGFDQAWVKDAGLGIDQAFDLDGVFPAIPEVIEILQRLRSDVFEHVAEPGFACIEEVAGPILIGIRGAPSDTVCADLIEMAVGPSHGGLDGQVQPVEPDVERHLDVAQDRGLDIVEGDLETGDGVGTHAATLRRSLSAAQFHGRSSSSLWMA